MINEIEVIPLKLKLLMNFFETFPEYSLTSTVLGNNKNNGSPCLLQRCDGPILPNFCLYLCLSCTLFIGLSYICGSWMQLLT